MKLRALLGNLSVAAAGWAVVWLGGLVAGDPGAAPAASPLTVTGQVFTGGHAVTCIRTGPTPVNVEKFPHFGESKPVSSVSSTSQTGDQDAWCDGSSNKESAFAQATLGNYAALFVDSDISSVRETATEFGSPVMPVVTSGAELFVTVNFGFNPASPPRPGFAYAKVNTRAELSPNGPACSSLGDAPCREVKFKIGSDFQQAVNRRTVPVDEELLPNNQGVSYYIALKLRPVPGANFIDIPMLMTASAAGNGFASGSASLGRVEKPRGWILQAPASQQQAAEVTPADFPPVAVVDAGQAEPAPQGSVLISPPSGTLVPGQGFDLVLVAQTAGQSIAGLTASLDGLDVSGAVAGCGHGALTGGTPGEVIRCPGLSAGLLGPGIHTLDVSVTLSGGTTLMDSATWTVLGGAVGAAPGSGPSVEVTPPPGVYTETQAFDLGLVADLQGRGVVFAQIAFDEIDVTGLVIGCSSMGSVPTGQIILRCPGLSGAVLGPGTHFFHVVLDLDDGSQVVGGAVWEVLSAAGS